MPADRNKAMMFYASKLEQGVTSIDKPVEDTSTPKAPLIPVHRCKWLRIKIHIALPLPPKIERLHCVTNT